MEQSSLDMLRHGGVTLVLLIALSGWSWMIIVERWMRYRKAEAVSDRLVARVCKLVRAGQLGEARELCQREEGSLAKLLHVGLAQGNKDRAVLEEVLQRRAAEEMLDLDRRIGILGTLGSVAPYIGLFGTVLGIIRAFHNLAQAGAEAAGAAMVSAGISEALVATAAGLAVAVPAVVFYNTFVRKSAALDSRLALASSELSEAFFDKTKGKDAHAEE